MERLQFHPDPADDVLSLYHRLLGDDRDAVEATTAAARWTPLTAARQRLLALAVSFGLGPLAVAALDAELIALACLATAMENDAFAAGLRLGAVLAGLQVPGLN